MRTEVECPDPDVRLLAEATNHWTYCDLCAEGAPDRDAWLVHIRAKVAAMSANATWPAAAPIAAAAAAARTAPAEPDDANEPERTLDPAVFAAIRKCPHRRKAGVFVCDAGKGAPPHGSVDLNTCYDCVVAGFGGGG